MDAGAFVILMGNALLRQKLMELAVRLNEEILGPAAHINLRDFLARRLQLLDQGFRVIPAFLYGFKVAKALVVIGVICHAVILPLLHMGDLMHNEGGGHSGGFSEHLRVGKRGAQCAEAPMEIPMI